MGELSLYQSVQTHLNLLPENIMAAYKCEHYPWVGDLLMRLFALTSVILTTHFHSMCTEVMRTGEGPSIDKARLTVHRGKLCKWSQDKKTFAKLL